MGRSSFVHLFLNYVQDTFSVEEIKQEFLGKEHSNSSFILVSSLKGLIFDFF